MASVIALPSVVHSITLNGWFCTRFKQRQGKESDANLPRNVRYGKGSDRIGYAVKLGLLMHLMSSETCGGEVTIDGSLGAFRGALTGPDFQIDAGLGKQLGNTLFHSFESFNIHHPESATFTAVGSTNPIQNVLSRVTGETPSTIDGTLTSTIRNANLFFINPRGVLFGANAKLQVPASFHVSTADYLGLADGTRFVAHSTAEDALLTSARPEAFGFLTDQPAPIAVRSSALILKSGQTLSLIAGDFNYRGSGESTDFKGNRASVLQAANGRVNVSSVSSPGEARLRGADLKLRGFDKLGNIRLSNQATISTSGEGGGAISIRGGQLVMTKGSSFQARVRNVNGRRIDVMIDRSLQIDGGSHISTGTSGSGDAGDIRISGKSVIFESRSASRPSGLYSQTNKGSSGKGGTISVSADSMDVNGARVSASTFGSGRAGNIKITARDVLIQGQEQASSVLSGLFSDTNKGSSGDAGNITVVASSMKLSGNAGIGTRARAQSRGNGGNVKLLAERVKFDGGAKVGVGTFSRGRGGNVTVRANIVDLQGDGESVSQASGVFSNANSGSEGNGGRIMVDADVVRLDGNAHIGARARAGSSGQGGKITVNAKDLRVSHNASIGTSTATSGKGGDINIVSSNVNLHSGGRIAAASFGYGSSGEISIRALKNLRLSNGRITARTAQANADRLNISVGRLMELRDGSLINTSVAGGQGSGGNITISTRYSVLSGHSSIIAKAKAGAGGNISISAANLFQAPETTLSAASDLGLDGSVKVNAPDADVVGPIVKLPAAFLRVGDVLDKPCAARYTPHAIELTHNRYDVLPETPYGFRTPSRSRQLRTAISEGQGIAIHSDDLAQVERSCRRHE